MLQRFLNRADGMDACLVLFGIAIASTALACLICAAQGAFPRLLRLNNIVKALNESIGTCPVGSDHGPVTEQQRVRKEHFKLLSTEDALPAAKLSAILFIRLRHRQPIHAARLVTAAIGPSCLKAARLDTARYPVRS